MFHEFYFHIRVHLHMTYLKYRFKTECKFGRTRKNSKVQNTSGEILPSLWTIARQCKRRLIIEEHNKAVNMFIFLFSCFISDVPYLTIHNIKTLISILNCRVLFILLTTIAIIHSTDINLHNKQSCFHKQNWYLGPDC